MPALGNGRGGDNMTRMKLRMQLVVRIVAFLALLVAISSKAAADQKKEELTAEVTLL